MSLKLFLFLIFLVCVKMANKQKDFCLWPADASLSTP